MLYWSRSTLGDFSAASYQLVQAMQVQRLVKLLSSRLLGAPGGQLSGQAVSKAMFAGLYTLAAPTAAWRAPRERLTVQSARKIPSRARCSNWGLCVLPLKRPVFNS